MEKQVSRQLIREQRIHAKAVSSELFDKGGWQRWDYIFGSLDALEELKIVRELNACEQEFECSLVTGLNRSFGEEGAKKVRQTWRAAKGDQEWDQRMTKHDFA